MTLAELLADASMRFSGSASVLMRPIVQSLPFLAAILAFGYALDHYFIWLGPDLVLVTVGIVGGFLVKAFLLPLLKALVTGTLFRRFLRWLRGNRASKIE